MYDSTQELPKIAARARTLDERLSELAPAATDVRGLVATQNPFWERWCQAFSAGDEAALAVRLSWDGLDPESVKAALLPSRALPTGSREGLPDWALLLGRALEEGKRFAEELPAGASAAESLTLAGIPPETLDGEETPPFVELWIPFLREARRRLAESAPRQLRRLSSEALQALEGQLLADLAGVGALAAYERFELHRKGGEAPGYRSFVTSLLEGGFVPFFLEFSTLARQLSQVTRLWVEATRELLRRLESDASELRSVFGVDAAGPGTVTPRAVTAIETGLSDRHHGGRQVLILTFAGDGPEARRRLVYKPRDVALEAAYQRFLLWLAERADSQDGDSRDSDSRDSDSQDRATEALPPALRILERDGYGWIEYAAQEPAADLSEAHAYFRRAGGLLCLAHVLGGSDLHMDNLIATSRGPVIVDAEAFLQPKTAPIGVRAGAGSASKSALGRARQRIQTSFLSSGLLSFLQTDPTGRVYEIGGLLGRGGHLAPSRRRIWKHKNADTIRPEYEPETALEMANVLYLGDEAQDPAEFRKDLARGFAETYRLLLARRTEILAPGGPLSDFETCRTRVVLRPSNLYALVLERLKTPAYQRHGLMAGFLVESMNRLSRKRPERPVLWPLVADERSSLLNLDIPRFSAGVGADNLVSETGEEVRGFLERSGLGRTRKRLSGLGEEDLRGQLNLLHATLSPAEEGMHGAAGGRRGGQQESAGPALDFQRFEPPSREELLHAAERMAAELREEAIFGDDGAATWIAPSHLRLAERRDQGVSYHFYDGAAGIAFFLAALHRLTAPTGGDGPYRDLALAACRPIARVLDSPRVEDLLRHEKIGACSGLGSVVYGLVGTAAFLDSDLGLLDLATRIARHITPERIAADEAFDVEGGAAGAILGLLSLHRATGDEGALDAARGAAHHLLAHAHNAGSEGDRGGLCWPTGDGPGLAGFAHGAAGVAHALLELYRITQEEPLLEAARRAHRYEHGLYHRDRGNWPVLQRADESRRNGEAVLRKDVFLEAWCHGAPGIALSRAAARDLCSDEETTRDLKAALGTTSRAAHGAVDHLCCGNLGRAEILLTAGRLLDRPDLVEQARRRGAAVLNDLGARAGRREDDAFQPGFFRGVAGIGYSFLRLARPEDLPSALLFQNPSSRIRKSMSQKGSEAQKEVVAT